MPRVLVVDDDLGTRETYDAALQHAGYAVNLADSGGAAIAALSSGPKTHAVLLDLKLGDMTGCDVLRWMRTQGIFVPTAVMTAFHFEFDPDEAIGLGAMAYADQPLSIDDVMALAESLTTPPSPLDSPQRLHARVLAGDPGAIECLATVFLKAVPARLEHTFPRAPSDFAMDAAVDASLEYAANPAKFDPSLLPSVVDFVYMVARRNLTDRLRSESAFEDRQARYASTQTVVLPLDRQIGRSDIDLWACVLAVTIDPSERRAAKLWLDEAGNDAIAEALGVGYLPSDDQRREAKRFKDRLLKRLSRYLRPLPGRT
jgi:RNA polymerase sigma-70 factor (ECF subfamily)